jgi:glycosyltransferase involved in cell wall biosynthesis
MRLKVLVSAYACNPYQGSEPGVGWGWINAIAIYHEVWVITDEFNRPDIEKEVKEYPDRYKNIHFYYLPRIRWLKLEKLWPPSYHWTYSLWERAAYRIGCNLHKKLNFDLVHHLTYVGFRNPGFLWKLDIPFIWGPIGGLENTPWRLLAIIGTKGSLYYAIRNVINSLHKRFLSAPKRAFCKAHGGIIAATEGIRKEIFHWYAEDSIVICEIGPPPLNAGNYSIRNDGEPLRLSWSGQHVPGKALPLLFKALSTISADIDWHLDILGEGPYTSKWQMLSKKIGIASRCTWHGHLHRTDAIKIMHESHVFVITSIKDLTSTVTLEALSQGVPVICLDHCGFSDVINNGCGIKVPVYSQRQIVSDIADAVNKLAKNEKERRLLAKGALERIKDFSWEKKADKLNTIYRQVVRK